MRLHRPVAIHQQPHLGIPDPSIPVAGRGFARGGSVDKNDLSQEGYYDLSDREERALAMDQWKQEHGYQAGGAVGDSTGQVNFWNQGQPDAYDTGTPNTQALVNHAMQVYDDFHQRLQQQYEGGDGYQGGGEVTPEQVRSLPNLSDIGSRADWNKFESQARPSTNVERLPGSETLGTLGGFNPGPYLSRFAPYSTTLDPNDLMTRKMMGNNRGYQEGGEVGGTAPTTGTTGGVAPANTNAGTMTNVQSAGAMAGGIPAPGPGPAGAGVIPQSPMSNPGRPGWTDPNAQAAAQKNFYQNVTSNPATSPSRGTSYTPPTPIGGQRGQEWYGKRPTRRM